MKPYLGEALVGYGSLFHFTVPPPANIEHRDNLVSADSDVMIACVLANLQKGRFDVAEALVPLMKSSDSFWVWSAGSKLLAAAGSEQLLKEFIEWGEAREDEAALYKLCLNALLAGFPWAVEPTLQVLPRFSDDALPPILETYLSWLLEENRGPIFHGPDEVLPPENERQGWDPSPPLVRDEQGYASMVRLRLEEVRSATGNVLLAEGETVSVTRIAERLLARTKTLEVPPARPDQAWHVFSAMTGLDCRGFFDANGNFQRLTAAATVEDFLDSGLGRSMTPGKRYFFGREVPT